MEALIPDGRVAVMAVVNRTPDSFYDGGRTFGLDAAVGAACRAVDEGADWIDIGGLAFSPDTPLVSVDEETERVVPVIEELLQRRDIVVSVDTWRVEVARAAIQAGARVINDTSGLHDPNMADLAAATGASLVICHSLGEPHTHVRRPQYEDVVVEVRDFLLQRRETARGRGVKDQQIILDPGHDLTKNTQHTLAITRHFDQFAALGHPTVAAVSRKDFLAESLDLPKAELHDASVAAASWCMALGAQVIRMHDVRAGAHAARLAEVIRGAREPLGRPHHNV
ncbi:dihydropteroate synthase [Luteococcus sp. Sow4_B9]|uniref:dihydropteroate synthase n=1 Tax=Luteococcus sp. Sow4_B9 TaxID=3438792 RepID=UPI003F95DB3E